MTSSSTVGSTRITLQFGLDRDIDGAARDVQAAINAARADLPSSLRSNPTYRKVNPADAPILILALTSPTLTQGQLYDAAATVLQQKLSQIEGIGQVSVGGSSLPAVRVELNPARPVQIRHRAGGRARRAGLGQRAQPEGRDRGRRAALPALHQRPGQRRRPVPQPGHRLSQRGGRQDLRCGGGPGFGRESAQRRARQRQARGAGHPLPAAGRQHHRGGRSGEGRPAPAQGLDRQGYRHHRRQRPLDHDPRLAARRRADAADLHRPGDPRGLRVPAQRARHADPERGGAGLADRHLRGDVSAGLQPRQSLADGADRRHRLRRRRRHRGAGEHHPPYRGRHAALRGRHAWARARSASPCSR